MSSELQGYKGHDSEERKHLQLEYGEVLGRPRAWTEVSWRMSRLNYKEKLGVNYSQMEQPKHL